MIKDIPKLTVENVAVAIVKELNKDNVEEWNVYLLNLRNERLEGVLVSSTGYGVVNEEKIKTSTLRHFLDVLEPHSYGKIEPIMENVFGLNNEYWVSFYLNKNIYDKKYIFLPEVVKEENFIKVPLLNKPGVMIK